MTHLLRRPVATYAFDDLRVLAGPSAADDVDMLRRDVHLRRTAAELFKLLDVSGDALRQRDAKKGAASPTSVQDTPSPSPSPELDGASPGGLPASSPASPRSPAKKKKRRPAAASRAERALALLPTARSEYAASLSDFAEKRGFDYRYVPLLRRVAMCAAAKCARSPAARDALTDLVLKEAPLAVVKALSVAAKRPEPAVLGARAAAHRVPRLDADMDTDGLRQWFVDRHEPCVLAGWRAAAALQGGGAAFGDDAVLASLDGDALVPARTAFRRRPLLRALPVRSALPAASATLLDPSRDEAPPAVFGACFGPPHPEGCFAYVAPARAATAPHYDAMEQLLLVARGTKTLRLACPRDASRLDLGNAPLFNKCRLDAGGGSVFAALDAAANPVDVTLNAGDLLYLPAFWWHAVRSDDASTTLNYWFALHPDKAADA
ncbi:tRNAPhe (7-(3-amino-3-carboxypropyl)wyosine37-C2)-hydroxylase [Aureococcus anophagefferens]|uniref:tRNAPhe (7-(3-amino-3-carboxypropyl)wyosine37-C2)-hydroxylase n=1 Tax=Aureococcus anophagefferens TaxID=44056 RepID=A0ABR1GEY0_AURAN